MSPVVVIDYGSGNVFSVATTLKKAGADVMLSDNAELIASAERLVLPGVGAFEAAWNLLEGKGLVDPIRAFLITGRPFLGICVGMQMLMDQSFEFGCHPGFSVVEGAVRKIDDTDIDGRSHPVPRIGWYPHIPHVKPWSGTVLDGLNEKDAVYFVHSFAAEPKEPSSVLANSEYNGRTVNAAVISDNVTGVQFHPEKSGPVGLKIMENFIRS